MKTEKMFVGSLAVVISLVASGCAETTLTGRAVELGASTPMVAASPAENAAWSPPRPTPLADAPSHGTNRVATMTARALAAPVRTR